jgi:hypothetical protein
MTGQPSPGSGQDAPGQPKGSRASDDKPGNDGEATPAPDQPEPDPSPPHPPEPGEPPAPEPDNPPPVEQDQRRYRDRVIADEEEWRQRQRSLRDLAEEEAEASIGRDRIGRDSVHVTGGNSYRAERDIWISTGSREVAQIRYLTPDETGLLATCLVESPSHAELAEALELESLVFLRGAEGTGRQMAALAALLTWGQEQQRANGQTRVGIIHKAGATFLHPGPELEESTGYVFDVADERNAAGFDADAGLLKSLSADRHCRVVVLTPAAWTGLPGHSVDYRPPAVIDVFRRWLEHESGRSGVDIEILDGLVAEIDDELASGSSPCQAMELARRLVKGLKAGRSAAELRAEFPKRRRGDIRRRLDEHRPVLGRCFLTSAAVLSGLPETRVSQAAMSLAEHINRLESTEDEALLPAWQNLGLWLDYAEAVVRPGQEPGAGPTVHLKRRIEYPTLRVLWEDQPAVRRPLMDWLREIAETSTPQAQAKAAHAVGVLATFDFDTVNEAFIGPWSRSRYLLKHRLAAMVLESAVGNPDIAPRVHKELRTLADGTLSQQLTAIHALGSRIGLRDPGMALRELRKMGRSQRAEVCKAAAGAIGNLYSSDTASVVLSELNSWVDSGTPRRSADLGTGLRPAGYGGRNGSRAVASQETASRRCSSGKPREAMAQFAAALREEPGHEILPTSRA